MSDDLIRRAPERIFCHPTEKQPTLAKNKSKAKWLRGKWKDHDSAASGDVEYIRADLMADQIEKLEALVNRAENIFSNCLVVSGSCCCGEDMSHHSQYSGHPPTDHGEYQVQLWMKDLKNVR